MDNMDAELNFLLNAGCSRIRHSTELCQIPDEALQKAVEILEERGNNKTRLNAIKREIQARQTEETKKEGPGTIEWRRDFGRQWERACRRLRPKEAVNKND
ncbi:MAG: hypothetical protein Q4B70_00905 [Lachnospiraceae bacterium]|nr:hypothetical protein [Lachnospiraceae bacterium]